MTLWPPTNCQCLIWHQHIGLSFLGDRYPLWFFVFRDSTPEPPKIARKIHPFAAFAQPEDSKQGIGGCYCQGKSWGPAVWKKSWRNGAGSCDWKNWKRILEWQSARLSAKCENTNRRSFIQGCNCSFKIESGLRICNTWDKKEAKNATIKHCGHCRRPCNCAAKAWFTGQKKQHWLVPPGVGFSSCEHDQTAVTARFENLGKKEDANFLVMDPVRNLFPPTLGVPETLPCWWRPATFPWKRASLAEQRWAKCFDTWSLHRGTSAKRFFFYTSTPV